MSERPTPEGAFVSSSHAHFLEQISDEEFWSYAVEAARVKPIASTPVEEYLLCELRKKRCMLPLALLCEIMPYPHQFARLPATPSWMLGLAAWRGEIIGVIDLEAYLLNGLAQAYTNGMLLITQYNELSFGFSVSAVGSMTTLDAEQIIPTEQLPTCPHAKAIKGCYNESLILDVSVILADAIQHLRMTMLDDSF